MFLQEKIIEINKMLEKLKGKENIVVWGAGEHTCRLLEKTNLANYPIKSIVDIDDKKQGKRYFGFLIMKPSALIWDGVDAVIISVPGKEKQIISVLFEQLGFKGDIITMYEGNQCIPFYLLYDETLQQIRYMGDYESWEKADCECKGYGDEAIIDKVIASTEKVIEGSALWERDGYLFYERKYVYAICAAVLRCAIQNNNQKVRVLDIGGGIRKHIFSKQRILGRCERIRICDCRAG